MAIIVVERPFIMKAEFYDIELVQYFVPDPTSNESYDIGVYVTHEVHH